MAKIKVATPLVEMEGDEMAQILWRWVRLAYSSEAVLRDQAQFSKLRMTKNVKGLIKKPFRKDVWEDRSTLSS